MKYNYTHHEKILNGVVNGGLVALCTGIAAMAVCGLTSHALGALLGFVLFLAGLVLFTTGWLMVAVYQFVREEVFAGRRSRFPVWSWACDIHSSIPRGMFG